MARKETFSDLLEDEEDPPVGEERSEIDLKWMMEAHSKTRKRETMREGDFAPLFHPLFFSNIFRILSLFNLQSDYITSQCEPRCSPL